MKDPKQRDVKEIAANIVILTDRPNWHPSAPIVDAIATALQTERDRAEKGKPLLCDNLRLMDLVRYMRAKLYQEGLITEDEYLALSKEVPAGSPRRLEDYDRINACASRTETAERELAEALEGLRPFAAVINQQSALAMLAVDEMLVSNRTDVAITIGHCRRAASIVAKHTPPKPT
jgi:hypothetical protein